MNNDGIANGLAWFLGASGPGVDARSKLPTIDNTDENYLIIRYARHDDAVVMGATHQIMYSENLTGWTAATAGPDIIINVFDDLVAIGVDQVEVKISRSLAPNGRCFVYLDVTLP